MALKARVRQLAVFGNFALNILFALASLFVLIIGGLLVAWAFHSHPLLGLGVAALALALLFTMWSKKSRVGGLLHTVEDIVDGSAERAKEFLLGLLDELLDSVAMTFAVVPGVLVVGGIISFCFHYATLAGVLLALAVILSCVACCLYTGVKFVAHREMNRVISSIVGDGKADENTSLIAK